ncbi:CD209 antigen-like protein C [Asterias amurensis]|uniref:CD209 antigen-like protein C n=1 Tax=Asterias amurensis TaxID=7602 RepID=UPI003AB7A888
MVCKMLASKLLGVVGIIMMADYAAVNGRCWKTTPSTGGAPTGGTPTGVTPTGGTPTGGTPTGGTPTGGTPTGGTPTGGTPTGGTPTGGTPTGGTPRCPPNWSQWQDKCYMVSEYSYPWDECNDMCVGFDGMMVVPQTDEELQHLINLCSCYSFWIGCSDIETEGTWVCLDEGAIEVQDKRWMDGQPNSNGNEDCAKGLAAGWKDWNCGTSQRLICQRPVTPL